MAKVLIPLADGFEEIEAVTIIDVLRRGGVEVVTASIHETCALTGAHGIRMEAGTRLADVVDEPFDAIVLPGGNKSAECMRNCAALIRRLQRQKEDGKLLCAICAAPLVLVKAGVLGDKTVVTCYPTCEKDLGRNRSAASVVVDGHVITGRAPGSSMLFALVVLKALADDHLAHSVAAGLVTDVLN